jgi:Polyketide cyclase / dehydrase and lipid transport
MKAVRLFIGMIAGNVTGGLLCLFATWLAGHSGNYVTAIVYPNLVIIPFAIGLVAAWVWKPLNLTIGWCVLHSLWCTLLGFAAAWLILHEGVICLIIISPLIYVFLLAGALVGRVWFRAARHKINLSLLPLFALFVVAELLTRVDNQAVVTDEILIHAPPAIVWPHITSFPDIAAAPKFWLFRLGLPRPMATTCAGNYIGADRRCIFSGGAVFRETVAEITPNESLTFEIVESPPDPELIGHLTPHRGQFELRDNHNGTTTLIGRTWYTLHVRPAWYFDWWTRYIFRAVHLRVMENVRQQSEKEK